jgi:Holliday junction resolvase
MVNEFEKRGFAALRAGSSGAGTKSDLPDVLAGNGNVTVAIEEKYRTREANCMFEAEEVDALVRFAQKFGAKPYLAVRYSTRSTKVNTADWILVEPSDAPRTRGDNYSMTYSKISDRPTFTEFLNSWNDA